MKGILGFKKGQKGFTLVELLVVIAILGILAAVAVPNVTRFIGNSKTSAAATEKQTVQTAVTAAMAAEGVTVLTSANTSPGFSSGITPFGPSVDLVIVNTHVKDLIDAAHPITHSYTIADNGVVTQIP